MSEKSTEKRFRAENLLRLTHTDSELRLNLEFP